MKKEFDELKQSIRNQNLQCIPGVVHGFSYHQISHPEILKLARSLYERIDDLTQEIRELKK